MMWQLVVVCLLATKVLIMGQGTVDSILAVFRVPEGQGQTILHHQHWLTCSDFEVQQPPQEGDLEASLRVLFYFNCLSLEHQAS